MDKFLLAENPMNPAHSGLWIIHLLNPKAIIRCDEGHVETGTMYKHYEYKNKNNVNEEWTLSAYHFFTADFITEPEKQVIPLLDHAWRWFQAYLDWKDDAIDWVKTHDLISINRLEERVGIPQRVLAKAIAGSRALPEKYIGPLTVELKKYGFK